MVRKQQQPPAPDSSAESSKAKVTPTEAAPAGLPDNDYPPVTVNDTNARIRAKAVTDRTWYGAPGIPKWDFWLQMPVVLLCDAIALSCNYDPEFWPLAPFLEALETGKEWEWEWVRLDDLYKTRLTIAESNILAKSLGIVTPGNTPALHSISMADFLPWAIDTVKWVLPDPLLELATSARLEAMAVPSRWPWGTYETALLRVMADAVMKFWKNYDPSDQTTAPKKEEIVAWIQTQKIGNEDISGRTAEYMSTIIRADRLRPGRRTDKPT